MSAAPKPLAGRHPPFEEEEPTRCPRQDRLGDKLLTVPLVRRRIEQAQPRELGAGDVGVDVRREFARATRIEPDDGIFDGDRNPRIRDLEIGKEDPGKVRHTHLVGFSNWRQRTFPDGPKTEITGEPKARKQALDLAILLGDRQPHRHAPKNVCVGLARAMVGATDRPVIATGIRPELGITRPKPAAFVLPTRSK